MVQWSIGIDIVEIKRFRAFPMFTHKRFYERVFNTYEYQHCLQFPDPYPHFAGLFTAKEAVFKALNKFITCYLSEISIYHNIKGRPRVLLRKNKSSSQMDEKICSDNVDNLDIEVSISHSDDLAFSWAVVFDNSNSNNFFGFKDEFLSEIEHVIKNEFRYRCSQSI
jgi:holo-[acyl-carrier protein] synthase